MHQSWIVPACGYRWIVFITVISSLNAGTAVDRAYGGDYIRAVPLRLSVEEGDQTSLPCAIDMAARVPVSAVWFHVATARPPTHHNKHHRSSGHLQAKKVYALVAPAPPATVGVEIRLVDGEHWKQSSWTGRAFFSLLNDPPALRLNKLHREDTGSYFCNVSYSYNATSGDDVMSGVVTITEARVELFVAAHPCPPVIKHSGGNALSDVAGPFAEGDKGRMTCDVETCQHDVMLSWYRDGAHLKMSYQTVATSDGGWRKYFTIDPVLRSDLHSNLTCVATSNVSLPASASVLLDVYLAPISVAIWSWPQELSEASGGVSGDGGLSQTISLAEVFNMEANLSTAGQKARINEAAAVQFSTAPRSALPSFQCEASGSRPPANITWFLDGLPLDSAFSQSTSNGNVTVSMLLLPETEGTGKLLECRATNKNFPPNLGELSRFLKVDESQKMEVTVRLGAGLNRSHISEGVDVYMECHVLTVSKLTEVTWRLDQRELKKDAASQLLFTSRHLVIRKAELRNAGRYTCTARSVHGQSVESAPLELRIRHAPKCRARRDWTMEARINEAVNVNCDVIADPDDGLRYFWIAEDGAGYRRRKLGAVSGEIEDDEAGNDRVREGSSSRLEVTVDAYLFQATLYCWAKNAVGTQREPCRYKFTLRRERASGLKCSFGNYTESSFSLTCTSTPIGSSGSDVRGPLVPRLRFELFDAGAGNRSERGFWTLADAREPYLITGLKPATDYLVVARQEWAETPFSAYVRTLAPAQTLRKNRAGGNAQDVTTSLTTIVVVLVGVAALVSACLVATCVLLLLKRHRRKAPRSTPNALDKKFEHKAYLASHASPVMHKGS
ncbi:uncharacterized protein LOC144151645 [Haemaphysalis longicornis]